MLKLKKVEEMEKENCREIGIETFITHVKDGWCGFFIKNEEKEFTGRISYINDFPLDVLNAFDNYLKYDCPPVICCDEESTDFLIVVDEYWTYIISERDNTECIRIEIDRENFIDYMIKDIEEHLDDFATSFGDAEDDIDILNRKIKILTLIKTIKEEANW